MQIFELLNYVPSLKSKFESADIDLLEIDDDLSAELNLALELFNFLHTYDNSIFIKCTLINAAYLSEVLDKRTLPSYKKFISELNKASKPLIEETIQTISEFDFIENTANKVQLFSCLFIGTYRSFYRVKIKKFKQRNVQIASAIEEILGLLALQGYETQLFRSIRHWIIDYKVEGFSKEFSHKIASNTSEYY
jgi:hypothetical protein